MVFRFYLGGTCIVSIWYLDCIQGLYIGGILVVSMLYLDGILVVHRWYLGYSKVVFIWYLLGI